MSKRTVLITDDEPAIVQALSLRFSGNGFDVETAANGLETILKMKKRVPDVMIVDIDMPETDGFRVCERVSELQLPTFPVIVLTGRSDAESVRRCEQLGVHHVPKSADMWDKLESRVDELLQSSERIKRFTSPPEPDASAAPSSEPATSPAPAPARTGDAAATPAKPKILLVDDDRQIIRAIKIRLENRGVDILEAENGMDAYMIALQEMPDVVITDYLMPEGSGDHMLVRMKQNQLTRNIPVIVLTGKANPKGRDHGFQREILGRRSASALLAKPIDFDALIAELEKHISVPLEVRH